MLQEKNKAGALKLLLVTSPCTKFSFKNADVSVCALFVQQMTSAFIPPRNKTTPLK